MPRFIAIWIFFFLIYSEALAQLNSAEKDTLFFQHTETKVWVNPEGSRTNLIKVKAEVYAPPRIFVKKDSLYKPTKVRVSLSFERAPEAKEAVMDSTVTTNDFAQVVLMIYQLHVNKMRKEFYRSTLKKGQTLHLQEIIERNFQDMIETDLRFRDETENGSLPDKVRSWQVVIQRELDAAERK